MSCRPRLRNSSRVAPAFAAMMAFHGLVHFAIAQLPTSRLDSVFPAGVKAGTTTAVLITGAELTATTELRFSHAGLTATRSPTAKEGELLFEVTAAQSVPAGCYDVLALGPFGLSNPRTICVGWRDEKREQEPNQSASEAGEVTVGTTLNGQISPATDVDGFRFRALKGRPVVADCLAARIDSPLAPVMEVLNERGRRVAFVRSGRNDDAVLVFVPPDDGEYTLRVYDQTYRGGPGFVYRIELHEEPYVVSTMPLASPVGVESTVTLLGVNLPQQQASDFRWRNQVLNTFESTLRLNEPTLDYDRVMRVTPVQAGMDSKSWRLAAESGQSQPVRRHISETVSVPEAEPNQELANAQALTLPADISGRFASPGDIDRFRMDVAKGDVLWIEVFAQREGSPVDASLLVEFAADGNLNALSTAGRVDDSGPSLMPVGFDTRTDDPAFRFEATANGACFITVRDQYGQTRGDATLTYRLVVRQPRPDIRLVAVPTEAGDGMVAPQSLRRGGTYRLQLLAFRQDGFSGPIEVPATELGQGLVCEPTFIPAGMSSGPMIVRAREDAATAPVVVQLKGRAVIGEGPSPTILERDIRPAVTIESTRKIQGQNSPAQARLAREFVLQVMEELSPVELVIDSARREAMPGGTLELSAKLVRRDGAGGVVTVTVEDLPKDSGLEIPAVIFAEGETERPIKVSVKADARPKTHVLSWVARTKVAYRRRSADGTPGEAKELDFEASSSPLVLDVKAGPAAVVPQGSGSRGGLISKHRRSAH